MLLPLFNRILPKRRIVLKTFFSQTLYTGWSWATVFYDFYLTGIKNTKLAKPNHFCEDFIWTFWYFDIPKGPGEKIPSFQGCAKMVCFPSWHGSRVSGSVCLSLLVSVYTWCSLYDMRGHLGISGSVFRKKSICFGDQMSLGVHLRA